ncbi:hypothetical protein LOK49_LG12G03074 [Camellia lanceoleosa]|uniref:Uncharacterized protein n=1 Tax=Camellia lanceoleosa TaxID=1840588 RepID=A0ACC0FPQ1_9ERIC|nr:hypothetical protein LOK49_LG12G03074 [Camellia lanceoleosa]
MVTQIAKCLVSVLIVAMFLTLASSGASFIVTHKKATLTRLKFDVERVSASIDIYNQGSATAYDVSLTDDSWSKVFFSHYHGALVSHAFELESKVQALFYGAPAVITFRIPTKAALQEAYATPILPLDILADRPLRLLAKYRSLISVISIMASFVYLVATPSKSNAAKGGKKKH